MIDDLTETNDSYFDMNEEIQIDSSDPKNLNMSN